MPITLAQLLSIIHLETKLMILDESIDTYIYESDCYDGYDSFPSYAVTGVRVLSDSRLLVIVKPM